MKLETLQQDPGSPGHYSIQEEASGHILYKGRPGIDCGHSSAEASSYFDRYNVIKAHEKLCIIICVVS